MLEMNFSIYIYIYARGFVNEPSPNSELKTCLLRSRSSFIAAPNARNEGPAASPE
jgi:hypothetical protein